ncbi:MAG TPA: histidine phosphatase family protein [Jiangellaceae bacterium]|nr:histidine phosphatase family protein [Jiangellaceae bacterium]
MPRTLVLLRHAKSAWPDDVPDSERPLAKRGRRDAPAAGRWLQDRELVPEVALVSSARRAVETFELVAAELSARPRGTVTAAAYGASAGDLLDLVHGLADDVGSVLLVGHNPGIGRLASVLDEAGQPVREFPTSALAVFDVDGDWSAVDPGTARLVAFAVPRG